MGSLFAVKHCVTRLESPNGEYTCSKTEWKVYNLAPNNKRGTHLYPPHAIDATVRDKTREHIKYFPTEVGHYVMDASSKLLSPKLYRLFQYTYPDSSANATLYRKIFKTEFNMRFDTSKSDPYKLGD
ncbi:hypothetical protein PR048_009964 [Dryococelus australis]|uniref:Uncharacterized protein n=1 Tax=Dryococelus australis TaxID=614101 RepID=A0ABQ9I2G0_9NEOP|nr:hypothetical protein PR048_009964 [Dryococelus australis]